MNRNLVNCARKSSGVVLPIPVDFVPEPDIVPVRKSRCRRQAARSVSAAVVTVGPQMSPRVAYVDPFGLKARRPIVPPLCKMRLLGSAGSAHDIQNLQRHQVEAVLDCEVRMTRWEREDLLRMVREPDVWCLAHGRDYFEILLRTGAKVFYSQFNRKYYGGTGFSIHGYAFAGQDVLPYWMILNGETTETDVRKLKTRIEVDYWKSVGAPKMAEMVIRFGL